jgi:hypothetical protein
LKGRAVALQTIAAAIAYVVLAIAYTWPLPHALTTEIAIDPWDPILNATVLWWNATHLPFSTAWWNAPQFYPSAGVSAFTENLMGISVIASPVYWITGSPIAAYNSAFFLTWPLSGFFTYLLVRHLTRRSDAAFLAGLVYAFVPYRIAELGHVQVLATYGLPLVLLGLHGYMSDRRPRWLVLFSAAWIVQSLANGYFMLFGAVLVGLWLVWFGTHRDARRLTPPVLATWLVASLPLLPVLIKYKAIHEQFGMRREPYEALYFSARPQSFFQTSNGILTWGGLLPDGKDNLFPGLTVLLLVAAGLLLTLLRTRPREGDRGRRITMLLGVIAAASIAAAMVVLARGPLNGEILGIPARITDLNRALLLMIICGGTLIWTSPRARAVITDRHPFAFYVTATLVIALLSCGPVLRVGEDAVLSPAPYQWLMALPGFDELRVPVRFWMLGTLCLAVAGGLAFARLPLASIRSRRAAFLLATCGVLADGWIGPLPMAAVPPAWADVPAGRAGEPVLELHDPGVLAALASLTAFTVIVPRATDPDGEWLRYALAATGAAVVLRDDEKSVVHVPGQHMTEIRLGKAWPIASVSAFRHDTAVIWDGKLETEWGDNPQRPGQWLVVDLGTVRDVGGLTHALGEYARDFPRRLAIDVSVDGERWERVWENATAAAAFLAAARGPREAALQFVFAPHPARYVRLQQLATHRNMWRVAELQVHAP